AAHIRRELLDLARHFAARGRQAVPLDTALTPDAAEALDDLDRWCGFHEGMERLPAEEREVVSLIFYHGWEQTDVADLFQVSVRTVQRRWDSALVKLHGRLRAQLPER